MKIRTSYILTILVLILNYGQLNAAVFPTFEGNSTGEFTGAIGGANITTVGQSVLWGTFPLFGERSSLTYAGNNPFSVDNSDPFSLATLTYLNTSIVAGTGISNVTLTGTLDFNNPAIVLFDFIVDLAIDNTLNTGSSDPDTVILTPVSSFPSLLGTIDSMNYFFTILGFRDSNNAIVNSFTQAEGSTGVVDLVAQITTVNQVPVPATFWLILTALTGMFIVSRRKAFFVKIK